MDCECKTIMDVDSETDFDKFCSFPPFFSIKLKSHSLFILTLKKGWVNLVASTFILDLGHGIIKNAENWHTGKESSHV